MVSKIGLGTVQFGLDYGISNHSGITGIEEVKKILSFAREVGIDMIDTAYGYGKSEEVLGLAGIQDLKIVTKFLPESYGINLQEQVRISLERLKTGRLYGLLAHRPMDILENPNIWGNMLLLKKNGIVEKIGFSFNKPEEADKILDRGFTPDLIQAPFNYLDSRFRNLMILLKDKGCEIHSRSTFLQGLFFVSTNKLPKFFEEIKPILSDIQRKGELLPTLLLKHCMNQGFIDRVIFGVNNQKQLKQNIERLEIDDVLPALDKEFETEILTPSSWPQNG